MKVIACNRAVPFSLVQGHLAALLCGSAIMIPAVSHAQDAAPANPPAAAQTQTQARAPDAPNGGEIVVTAQRRSEIARDVPLSITAQSGEQLQKAGVTDSRDLTALTPGLKMDRVGAFSVPALRGVTTQLTTAGIDVNVATYLDDVYQPSQLTGTFDLPDVQRVEVLKGPQGTLFGRNATGGAIRVFTLNPTYETTGNFSASYGNYNEVILKGFISTPLVADKLAASVSAYFLNSDGYNHDELHNDRLIGGSESWVVRGKLRYDPTDRISFLFTAYASYRSDGSTNLGLPLNGNTAYASDPEVVIPTKPYETAMNLAADVVRQHGFSLKATADLGFATLTSTTAYQKSTAYTEIDGDYAYEPSGGAQYHGHDTDRSISEELSLGSQKGHLLDYTVGLFYYDAYGQFDPLGISYPGASFAIYGRQDTTAYAAFGELYLNPVEHLQIIGGIRYSYETRDYYSALGVLGGAAPTLAYINKKSWGSATPRASIKYEILPKTNVYFTYSQGFKSGSFNTSSPADPTYVNPEHIYAYEIGIKSKPSSWLDFSLAGFFYNYKDIQVNAYANVNGIPVAVVQNAAAAHNKGIDFESVLTPLRGLAIHTGLSLLSAKFSDFPDGSVTIPITNAMGVPTGGNYTTVANLTGKHEVRAPNWTLNVTASYQTQVAHGQLELDGMLYHSDKFYFDNNNRIEQPAYTTLGARVSWSPQDTGLTFAVYGKNLTNKATIQGAFITAFADGVSYAPPRTYGVEIRYAF